MRNSDSNFSCPIAIDQYPTITLAHGGGGRLMNQLIDKMFKTAFENDILNQRHDAAFLEKARGRLAFTTDSFVVNPLVFPGGDIGMLAVNGTVNDLAMAAAQPLYLSCAFILEEGLSMQMLWGVVQSMKKAAQQAGVFIVTGDTKVVDKGKGDGIFITTAGIGIVRHDLQISPAQVQKGDVLIVNGDLGRHGMAIMAVRENLAFESQIESDTASLAGLVQELITAGIEIHCLRDLTRGGLASALNEIAEVAGVSIHIKEEAIAIREDVHGACEILGFDPIYVANEGRLVAFVKEKDAQRALALMKKHELGKDSSIIGRVTSEEAGLVTMNTRVGSSRIIDMLSGEQLPRIC